MNFETIESLYDQPLLELISRAHQLHLKHHPYPSVQVCTLISIKTGGCPEDCQYCPQSSRYQTTVKAEPLMKIEQVMNLAKNALKNGSTRICLGAAWKGVKDDQSFTKILKMIEEINYLGAEVCCTLGLLQPHHAEQLKKAGLYAYNHNLDSSREFYQKIITTRTYDQRLQTLKTASNAGLKLCCGAILGMGETKIDRINFLLTLSQLDPSPDSIPLNCLVAVSGTPLANQPPLNCFELIRMVAVTRILFPKSMIRLSAGRDRFNEEQQALCFIAGANSIFSGEKLLTVANRTLDQDTNLFEILGIQKLVSHQKG